MKVYANTVGYTINDEELVEALFELKEMKETNYGKYVLMYKRLCDNVRKHLDIKNLIGMSYNSQLVIIHVYNVMAGEFDVFKQGRDEIGMYVEVGEA